MKRSCRYCGRTHGKDEICPKKPKQFKKRGEEERFRSSAQWQKKRKTILERDKYMCRICAEMGIINSKNIEVHHIIPLRIDFSGRLEDDNLISLCSIPHHEQAERGDISAEHLRELTKKPVEIKF